MRSTDTPTPLDVAYPHTYMPRVMRGGFAAVLLVIALITALSFWRAEVGNRVLNEIVAHEQVAVELLYRMQFAARDRTFALFAAVHTDDPFAQDAELRRYDAQGAAFAVARAELIALPLTERERALLALQGRQVEATMAAQWRVIELMQAGDRPAAEHWLIARAVPLQNQVIDTLTALLDEAIARTKAHAEAGRRDQNRATLLLALGGLAGMLLTWAVFIWVTRKMKLLVAGLADAADRLQASNLDLGFQKQALDMHNIVSVADAAGRITAVNDKFCAVSQYAREELVGQNHRLLKSGRHPDAFYADMWATISAGKVWQGEICNRRKDGSLYWVASTILPFMDSDGLPSHYVSVRTDITTIKQAQHVLERSREDLEELVAARTAELAEREEALRSITNAAQDAVIMTDARDRVTHWNRAATQMFGYSAAEMLGQPLHERLVPARYQAQQRDGLAHFARTGDGAAVGRTTTRQARHRDGREFPVDISLSALRLRGEWNAVGIVRDATERVQTEERLKQLATTDTLTGLCNRRRFNEVLAGEIRRATRFAGPLSLIMFDIDHFKRVNDTYGHQVGDQVLIQLAVTVGDAIRATDLLARWGGEEFVVLLPGSDIESARVLAEKLRMRVEKQDFPDAGHITSSFGIAVWSPGDTADELVQKSDAALYRAKAGGRNRVERYCPASGAGPA